MTKDKTAKIITNEINNLRTKLNRADKYYNFKIIR